jgi:hypothetical protein
VVALLGIAGNEMKDLAEEPGGGAFFRLSITACVLKVSSFCTSSAASRQRRQVKISYYNLDG